MSAPAPLVSVLHGVNLDQLGNRNPLLYGDFTLAELEQRIERRAAAVGLRTEFFQSNHEGAYVERLHSLRGRAQAAILNPGSWTHYARAIRDALEIAELPAVEVHISDIERREPWRRESVIRELCFATISGRGAEGYDEALGLVQRRLREGA